MSGFTQAYQQTLLNYAFPTSGAGDCIAYSTDGVTEFTSLARTPIGTNGWALATPADPSVKANNTTLTSAQALGSGTLKFFAVFSAATGGVQKTDWKTLDVEKTVGSGDVVQWPAGQIFVTLD